MFRCLFVIVLVAACSSTPPQQPPRPPLVAEMPPTTNDPGAVQDERPLPSAIPPEGSTGSGSAVEPRPEGASCFAAGDCASGICEGEGCGPSAPGRCMPKGRACTRDLRAYCGCDGKTFRTSGSCPGQRFSGRQACPSSSP